MTATSTRAPRREQRRPMTPREAQSFEYMSEKSAEQILAAIEARAEEGVHENCECEAYEDVFTWNRWQAQGMHVRKGEKALRIASYVPITSGQAEAAEPTQDAEAAPAKRRLLPKTLFLFCRCQVERDATTKHGSNR